MKHTRSRGWGVLVGAVGLGAAIALSGCSASIATVGPQKVRSVEPARIAGAYVPAGVVVHARLETPIDTQLSVPGQPLVATVTEPVLGTDGSILIPTGAMVRGEVASTGDMTAPRLRLDIRTVDTARGQAPIRAAVHFAEHNTRPGTPVARPTILDPWYDDGYGGPFDAGFGWHLSPRGGGPWAYGYGWGYGYEIIVPREIHMPRGATVDLRLTRPLLPPGSTVRPQ